MHRGFIAYRCILLCHHIGPWLGHWRSITNLSYGGRVVLLRLPRGSPRGTDGRAISYASPFATGLLTAALRNSVVTVSAMEPCT